MPLKPIEPLHHAIVSNCPKCDEIMRRYPDFHPGLWQWFQALQEKHPEAHVSSCGRGKLEQNEYFKDGTSDAPWGESAHNYNLALDIFRLSNDCKKAEYPKEWFKKVVGGQVSTHNFSLGRTFSILWYGAPNAVYPELPHCEVRGWRAMKDKILVER